MTNVKLSKQHGARKPRRTKYSAVTIKRAITRARSGVSIPWLAETMGIPPSRIYEWIRAYD